jgi:hypothetical protein
VGSGCEKFRPKHVLVDMYSIARITEVLDPKGLREGMNRQDTTRHILREPEG